MTLSRLPGSVALGVMAKAPVPGRSKTRMCPPLTHEEAAALADAALVQTLGAMAEADVRRRLIVLDGDPAPWLWPGFEIVPQRGNGLAERLIAAVQDAGGPVVLINADSPQVTAALLERAARALDEPGVEAVIGPADDGGYWAIGLREANARVFRDVPMSSPHTFAAQAERLHTQGLAWTELPPLRDVDRFQDAIEVAALIPGTRFARQVERILHRLARERSPMIVGAVDERDEREETA